jgi:hypothetical protein
MDADEAEAQAEAKAFRAGSSAISLAVLANVLLAALCLGVPYYRGHLQAEASLRAFSRFAACLLGAEAKTELGLGMPAGEREHFASLVMRGPASWPARCEETLRAVAPEAAIFLWPSVKQAGADVRAVVRLVGNELSVLARARKTGPGGRVSARPLLALAKLRAVLSLFARAANADTRLDANAVRFKQPAALAEPARLPIVAGSNAALEVWAGPDGLSALALDARGISWLRVEGGKLEHRRVKRTSQVRAVLRIGTRPLIVWATASERCEKDEHHCARRATGVAYFDETLEQLPPPIWLGGHPAGRVDRSLRLLVDDRIDLLARSDARGALEVRRFDLAHSEQHAAPETSASAHADAPPLVPLQRFALPAADAPTDALLLQGQPAAVVYAIASEAGTQVRLWQYEAAEAPLALSTLTGAGAFIEACESDGTRFIVFGTHSELGVVRVATDGHLNAVLPATSIALGDPLHPQNAGHDRLRVLCRGERATLVAATVDGTLITLHCDARACERGPELARDVASFDATVTGEKTLVAYSTSAQPQLVVTALDDRGQPLGQAQTPAACWDPPSGMCGQPTLVAEAGRVLLCARDGADLLALESDDGSEHWKPISGLKVSGAIDTDGTAPMQQHRVRKGLD